MSVSTPLEKHKRYGFFYKPNDLFWGLGIERESYLEFSDLLLISGEFIKENHRPERYSVDYYKSYKSEALKRTLSVFDDTDQIHLPLLINSHTLTKLDTNLEHQTIFGKKVVANSKFQGKCLFDILKERDPYFQEGHEKWFTFDGDSIELITQDFYKTTAEKVYAELLNYKSAFEQKVESIFKEHLILSEYGTVKWATANHGFAVMSSNLKNLAMFNNGTYHINLTMPTELTSEKTILNPELFRKKHQTLARMIQWLEPLFIGCFGSPDPLSFINSRLYSAGSQRGAMSRYIGLGTFDTDKMPEGKLLTVDLKDVKSTWYQDYHFESGYTSLDKVGLDLNYKKHWNHGLEIRFFDWFPESRLPGLLRFLIFVMDSAFAGQDLENPIISPLWNAWIVRVIQNGSIAGANWKEVEKLNSIFEVKLREKTYTDTQNLFADLLSAFRVKWTGRGECSSVFFEKKEKPLPLSHEEPIKPVTFWSYCSVS